jgi:probable phosphoglycerate mutase
VQLAGETFEILDWADTRHLADLPTQPVYDQQQIARTTAGASAADSA